MMTDTLLVLATSAPETGNMLNQAHALATEFGVNGKFLIAQIINFCLVAFILYKFAFKPVLNTIEERQKKIADGLQYAEEMKFKLEEAERKEAATLKKAQQEAQQIIKETRESAKTLLDQHTQEAVAKAEDILEKADHAIKLERTKMLSEVRREIARLVVMTAGRVLRKDLSEDDKRAFSESAAQELASTK